MLAWADNRAIITTAIHRHLNHAWKQFFGRLGWFNPFTFSIGDCEALAHVLRVLKLVDHGHRVVFHRNAALTAFI